MAATAEIINKPVESAISLRWIISARDDVIWFIGSVVSSYLLLFLYVWGIVPLIPMVAFWAILIDAPHVFGTFSRTYFDRTERHNRARLLWGSLLFFAIGPVLVLAGFGFVFLFVAALWAYYHLVKQHYGFMVLYKKKNGDLARVDNVLDRVLLLFAFNYPFVEFIARDPDAMARVPAFLRGGVNGFAKLLLAGTILSFVVWLGGDSDALDRVADADAAQANCDRRDTDDLSQLSVSPAYLVSQSEVCKCAREVWRRGADQQASAVLYRVRRFVWDHLPGTATDPRIPRVAERDRAAAGAATRDLISVGICVYSLLPGFEDLESEKRSVG
jgi:hypothetical protein